MEFDALSDYTPDEFSAFIRWLEARTINALFQARADGQSPAAAISDYLKTGYGAHLSRSEIIDYFCVSYPNIASHAGYSDGEMEDLMRIFDQLNDQISPYRSIDPSHGDASSCPPTPDC